MTDTILVPIDPADKERAPGMIAVARKIGGDDARLILTSVVEDIPTYVAVELPGGAIDKARGALRADLRKIAQDEGIEAEIEVRKGQAATAINSIAKEKNANVIIIASHKPEFADYFLGSTAAKVVRHAPCSVFVIR